MLGGLSKSWLAGYRRRDRGSRISAGHHSALSYNQADLQAINPADARNLTSAYASLELADGSNVSALTTVGNIRANAANIQQKILNLENDSLSPDAALNTQVEVLNKINASNVLTLRTLEDANNLRLAALEQQILQSKQQRDADVANLNFTLKLRQQSAQNLAPFTANLTQSLASYQLPYGRSWNSTPGENMNFFDSVLQAVNALVQQNIAVFDGMGQHLFRAFATILVVWYGLKAALSASEHRGTFHFANFVTLILMISFGFAMVNYYDSPIPGTLALKPGPCLHECPVHLFVAIFPLLALLGLFLQRMKLP